MTKTITKTKTKNKKKGSKKKKSKSKSKNKSVAPPPPRPDVDDDATSMDIEEEEEEEQQQQPVTPVTTSNEKKRKRRTKGDRWKPLKAYPTSTSTSGGAGAGGEEEEVLDENGNVVATKKKKKRRYRPGTKQRREAHFYQNQNGMLVRDCDVRKMVKESLQELIPQYERERREEVALLELQGKPIPAYLVRPVTGFQLSVAAICALQASSQTYVEKLITGAQKCQKHTGRDTIKGSDIRLAESFTNPSLYLAVEN